MPPKINYGLRIPDTFTPVWECIIDLRYQSSRNCLGRSIYPPNLQALLRTPVAKALEMASLSIVPRGYRIKVWDAWRPVFAQDVLWAHCPDPRFVVQPIQKGEVWVAGSNHSRGAAVDVTLVDLTSNREVAMPSDFDDFTAASSDTNAFVLLLRATMEDAGFVPNEDEWWHFDWREAERYPFEYFLWEGTSSVPP